MKPNGFTVIEMVVSFSLVAMIALAATTFTFHSLRTSERTEDRLTVVTNVQNAGFWVSHDTYMADNVLTDNLTPPAILILKWTDWGYDTDNVYYSATYSIDNVTANIGQLNRRVQNSNGGDQTLLLARYIYYNPSDPANTTRVSYQNQTIDLTVATRFGSANETRDYQTHRRPKF